MGFYIAEKKHMKWARYKHEAIEYAKDFFDDPCIVEVKSHVVITKSTILKRIKNYVSRYSNKREA
jgi:hypothetical protein